MTGNRRPALIFLALLVLAGWAFAVLVPPFTALWLFGWSGLMVAGLFAVMALFLD